MEERKLSVSLGAEDLRNMIKTYHFSVEDLSSLQSLNHMLAPLLRVKAYYIWKEKGKIISYEKYAVVFLTLGDGADALQEFYLGRKCLTEAYIVECLSLELLKKAYGELVREIQAETGKWAVKIDFLGDTYPLGLLPDLSKEFGQMDITYNDKFVLSPGKSVVFLLPVSEKKIGNPCNLCENCSNKECFFQKRDCIQEKKTGEEKLMHLYYGDGKGKTTAAIGLAVRAAGSGKKVLFVQFMKSKRTGELEGMQRVRGIDMLRSEKRFPFYRDMTKRQKEEQTEIHNRMLGTVLEAVRQKKYDVIILDEITYPYRWALLEEKLLKEAVRLAKGKAELVCTGRDPASFFLEHADYISEMKCVRHPFEKGIRAREGIEF